VLCIKICRSWQSTQKKRQGKDEREKVAGETKMPRPFSVIFSCYKNFSCSRAASKSPGTRGVRHRQQRMIYKHNKAFYVAFTTNRHVTRRRLMVLVNSSLSLSVLYRSVSLCIIFSISSFSRAAMAKKKNE
jgi:hypothetical protein